MVKTLIFFALATFSYKDAMAGQGGAEVMNTISTAERRNLQANNISPVASPDQCTNMTLCSYYEDVKVSCCLGVVGLPESVMKMIPIS